MARQIRYDVEGTQIDDEPLQVSIGDGALRGDAEKELATWRDFAARWHRSYYRAPEDEESSWFEELTDELGDLVERFDVESEHRG